MESDRASRFAQEIEALKIKDQSNRMPVVWMRLSFIGMMGSLVLGVAAYLVSHGTKDALTQRDAIVLGLLAVTLAVVSTATYLRFALTNFLRFWLARQSFDLQMQTESLAARVAEKSY